MTCQVDHQTMPNNGSSSAIPAATHTSQSWKNAALAVGTIFLVLLLGTLALKNGPSSSLMTVTASPLRRKALEMMAITQDPDDPLPLCGGDCDSDTDCQDGLVCFQRRNTEDTPGCDYVDGNPNALGGMDVCILDPTGPTPAPSISPQPTVVPPPTMAPTPVGTNSWTQTWGTTDAFSFVGPPSRQITAPPTALEENLSWLLDDPNMTNPRPLEYVGNDNDLEAIGLLGPCQSDCDNDRDCAGPLVCFQRRSGEAVPGCTGQDATGDDYCVWPEGYNEEEEATAIEPEQELWVDRGVALKLYWEKGYNWQNETFERKWCISRDFEGTCWYGLDTINCESDQLYINKCDGSDPRQQWKFIPVSSDEVLIQAYRNGNLEDLCFHRDVRKILLQPCNEQFHNQRWFSIRGGFNEERFELSQKTLAERCVNQDHHPKTGEVMRMHDCRRAQRHLTSWWELY